MANHNDLQPPPSRTSPADSQSDQSAPARPLASNNPYARHVTFAPASDNHVASSAQRAHPSSNDTYAPPPGPPPGYQSQHQSHPSPTYSTADTEYPPPQGPPPYDPHQSHSDPQPNHNWQSVPDTALFPPPPSIAYQESPRTNASGDSAIEARDWTAKNPLLPPRRLSDFERRALSTQYSSLSMTSIAPMGSLSWYSRKARGRAGVWSVSSHRGCDDVCFVGNNPLYSALECPVGSRAVVAYFEVKLVGIDRREDAGVALGFIAPPYPLWRLPGWERASLGVHSDDGRRYVNNQYGGLDFTRPFKAGDTLGIGVEFRAAYEDPQTSPPEYSKKDKPKRPGIERIDQGPTKFREVNVFFTRNGQKDGQWDLREELDSSVEQPGGVTGLEGERDLHAAVGFYGSTEFEVLFGRHNWIYQPTLE